MIKVYVDRNVNVQKMRGLIQDALGEIAIDFIQWPLEGKSKRIREYGLPAGEITFDDLDHLTWNELDFSSWDDFHPTQHYEQILAIVGKQNRKDCIHFDIAIKNDCSYFLTSDKDLLEKKEELHSLSQIQIYDPEHIDDIQAFFKAVSLLSTKS